MKKGGGGEKWDDAEGCRRSVATVPAFVKQERKKKDEEKAHVDAAFFRKLWSIFKVLVPGPFCGEVSATNLVYSLVNIYTIQVFYMFLVAASLLGRTYADVWMIMNTTRIET